MRKAAETATGGPAAVDREVAAPTTVMRRAPAPGAPRAGRATDAPSPGPEADAPGPEAETSGPEAPAARPRTEAPAPHPETEER